MEFILFLWAIASFFSLPEAPAAYPESIPGWVVRDNVTVRVVPFPFKEELFPSCDRTLPTAPLRPAFAKIPVDQAADYYNTGRIGQEIQALIKEKNETKIRDWLALLRGEPYSCQLGINVLESALYETYHARKDQFAIDNLFRDRLAEKEKYWPSSALSEWLEIGKKANISGDTALLEKAVLNARRLIPSQTYFHKEGPHKLHPHGAGHLLDYAMLELTYQLDHGNNAKAQEILEGAAEDILSGTIGVFWGDEQTAANRRKQLVAEIATVVYARLGNIKEMENFASTSEGLWLESEPPERVRVKQLKMAELHLRFGDPALGLKVLEGNWKLSTKKALGPGDSRAQWIATLYAWAYHKNGDAKMALRAARLSASGYRAPREEERIAQDRFIWDYESVTVPWEHLIRADYANSGKKP
ncbi:MAG: hypothetical protein CFE31_11010 [Rhizobiales bacterium PAR1]|nr:MAG: hypothetical protein CFE31_11010 [Rhizobiales bacterium PAR1]